MFLTFSNTILLIGLAGAVVPLVLHLLSRARYQSVDWGAMLFLEGLEVRQQYSSRINQVLLLVLRMAVVGLLAVALAQPVLQQWGPELDGGTAALRAADRGQILCLLGTIASAVVATALVVMLASSTGKSVGRLRRGMYLMLAIIAGVGAVSLGRRAAAWDAEVHRLMTRQGQAGAHHAAEGSLRPRIDAAILLDCSSSMSFEENGHARFALAQGAAKQVLAGFHRGDRASLILMGAAQRESELEPTTDLQAVADRIDAARVGHEPVDVGESLLRAQEVLDREGAAARDLYVVCDRQASNWRGVNDFFMTHRWPEAVAKSGAAVRLFIVPVGNADADNIAIQNIELANPPAIVGQPAELRVEVRNYGSIPRTAVPLTVSINAKGVLDTTVSIAAGQTARVSVPVKGWELSNPGSQVVSAEVRTSGYREDDHLDSVVQAIEPIRVLVISGDEWDSGAGQFRSESDFLRLALAPLQTIRHHGPDPCKVEVIPEDRWAAADLNKYDVVVLANIERFSASFARAVEQYVYGGGGVLIAPGSLTRVDNYNEQLWREGAGILPAPLQDPTSADGSEATTIVGFDPGTPVFQFLHDQPDLALSATIGRYFPTGSRPSDSRTLGWYTSGQPFLLESHAGRGKVLMMTTSLDADWSTLPLSSFYLPYLQSSVRYLAAGTMPNRNLLLGEPIQASLEDLVDDRVTIETPEGDPKPIRLPRYGSYSDLRYADTSEPGIYRIRYRDRVGDHALLFSARQPQEESDLTQLTDARWDELENGLHLRRIDPSEKAIATVVAGTREGYDLWPWAVGGALLLAAMELALAGYWSRDAY